jgi:hypothetical protein
LDLSGQYACATLFRFIEYFLLFYVFFQFNPLNLVFYWIFFLSFLNKLLLHFFMVFYIIILFDLVYGLFVCFFLLLFKHDVISSP